jgi:hypothetical protein
VTERAVTEPTATERTVVVDINQQQEQMLDRLIAEGGLGSSHDAVIRSGFLRFCDEHPEFLETAEAEEA